MLAAPVVGTIDDGPDTLGEHPPTGPATGPQGRRRYRAAMVFPDTRDADSGRSLLEREESALARKRQAINAGAKSLEAVRRASADARDALQTLRDLGFSQRELTDAFGLSRDEVAQFFPRRPRSAGTASTAELAAGAEDASASDDSGATGPSPGEDLGTAVDDEAQQPRQQPQAR